MLEIVLWMYLAFVALSLATSRVSMPPDTHVLYAIGLVLLVTFGWPLFVLIALFQRR